MSSSQVVDELADFWSAELEADVAAVVTTSEAGPLAGP